eukprot:9429-Heterococcus_DN1.PRE.2
MSSAAEHDECLQHTAARLKRKGHAAPVDIGTAVMPHLLDDDAYETLANQQFNSIVCEHHQKWEPLLVKDSTGADVYNFEHADKIIQWANHNGKIVKGHTLVWHVTSPQFIHTCSASRLREAVFEHIKAVMSHWYGQLLYQNYIMESTVYTQIDAWDVVNEALNYDATGSMADTPFLQKLGPQYIDECFKVARHTDPTARLIYNDNKVEGAGLPNNRSAKSDA